MISPYGGGIVCTIPRAEEGMDKISVVVVDDHPIFLAGLQQLFKKQADFELVGVAESADQLEAVLAQTTPDVILMDIEMPARDGISATVIVRKQRPGAKVVMLTGYDNPDLIFRALKAGAVGYLLKNTRSKEILDTLRRVAAGELFLNPELAGKFLREFQRDQEVEEVRRLVHTLTPREEEVLRLVATGANNREISQRLFISELTVKMHLASIFRKLQVNDRTKAAILALKAGLSTP
ncbi:MAG: response regulator transcription factor [Deltaproteobacteria bacterium]|nr:response regulator transcription factor [Deltaproteobacteria bacterium]